MRNIIKKIYNLKRKHIYNNMNKVIILLNNIYYLLIKFYTYFLCYSNKLYNKFKKNKKIQNLIYVKSYIEFDDNNVIFDYDFIIYKYLLDDLLTYNLFTKTHFNNINKKIFLSNYQPQLTEYKFILVKLFYNNKDYDITNIIKNKNNYFYVENNKLFDKVFMEWFCKKFLNIDYDSSMYIELYDNLMNKHQIYSNNYIILKKNNFDII
jgi:hypothetical protein